jgi:hypothetical protein
LAEDIPEAFTAGPEIHSILPLVGKRELGDGRNGRDYNVSRRKGKLDTLFAPNAVLVHRTISPNPTGEVVNGQAFGARRWIPVAIVLAAVAIAGSIVVATQVVNRSITTTTTSTTSTTTTTTSTTFAPTFAEYTSDVCLKEVPQDATFGIYSNSTSQGTTVTFSNGTEHYFPTNSCPVPVTPDNYWIDSIVEANPAFIAAENGSIYEATNSCNCQQGVNIVNSTGAEWTVLNFVLYSDQQIYPCGSSWWTYYQRGLILVTIPIHSAGGYEFSDAQIQVEGGFNDWSCTTSLST